MQTSLIFSTSIELLKVAADAVVAVRADGNYSAIILADREEYILTLQLGQIEQRIAEMLPPGDNRFIRIGKSLIVNSNYITLINPSRQKLILSDGKTFRMEFSASKEALKALKDLLEKGND